MTRSSKRATAKSPLAGFSGEALRMMYVQRAAAHLNKHHIDLALRDCDEAAKIGEDSDNFRCRARIYVAMGAFGRAIEANFFSGELALRQGAKEQAARLF